MRQRRARQRPPSSDRQTARTYGQNPCASPSESATSEKTLSEQGKPGTINPESPTIIPGASYFAAIALIVASGVSNAGKLFLLLLYCVVYALPLIVIAVVFAAMGKRAEGVVQPVGDWLFAHWPVIIGPLTAVIGVGILAFGVVELTST